MANSGAFSSADFQGLIVDPFILRLREDPTSMPDAFGVVCSISALSNHIAHERNQNEGVFSRDRQDKCWQFRAIWEAANAAKHAVLKLRKGEPRDLVGSENIKHENVDGFLWYFAGSEYCGEQVIVELDWTLDTATNTWNTGAGKLDQGIGPFTNWVPVLDLIGRALECLGKTPSIPFEAPCNFR